LGIWFFVFCPKGTRTIKSNLPGQVGGEGLTEPNLYFLSQSERKCKRVPFGVIGVFAHIYKYKQIPFGVPLKHPES